MRQIKGILRNFWPLLLIIFISGFLFTYTLNRDLLTDWDECVYAQQAVEMKQTGNFITNQWNKAIVFEKPPLNNWLLQPAYLFGVNEFTTRFTMVLLGLSTIVLVYLFSKKYFSTSVAVLSSVILLAAELFVVYSSRVNTDIGFTLFTFAGIFAWLESYKKPKLSYLAGLLFGLAVLNKGLSITPYIAAIGVTLFFDFNKQYVINFAKMILTFLIAIIPWHLYHLTIYGSKFFQVYIIEHIIKRARNPLDYHFEGRLFYAKLIYANIKPWIFFVAVVPFSYVLQIKKLLKWKFIKKEIAQERILLTIVTLIIIPLIAITQVKTRIAWYALPIYPFLAIFIAYSIDTLLRRLKIHTLILVIILLISVDAFKTITTELKTFDHTFTISPRNEVFIAAQKYPQTTIDYLVEYGERRANEVLTEPYRTSTTFVYGGNPCAVYYSRKKVNYYYSIKDFQKRLEQGKGLFVVENGDETFIGNEKIKRLLENKNFILFEK